MSAFPAWQGADNQTHRYYMRTQPLTYFPVDSQLGHGCVAVKRELQYNNVIIYQMDSSSPVIGLQAYQAITAFQYANMIQSDGVAGPQTCHALFMPRTERIQVKYNIPDDLLAKLIQLESQWDPAARGSVDPRDRGLGQINSQAHPTVTDAQADDPAFSIEWSAKYIRSNFNSVNDWDVAIASYNVGLWYAVEWQAAGKPASGLSVGTIDYAARCTSYVNLVKKQVVR